MQAEAKRREEREAKLQFDSQRTKFVQGAAEDAMAKAYMDHIAEKKKMQSWGECYKSLMDERSKQREYMSDLEMGLLTMADNQTSGRYARDDREKERHLQKVLNNAAKQKRAGTWLKENIFDKVVDSEDANIAKDKMREEAQFVLSEEQGREKKSTMAKALLKFHEEDRLVKQQRLKQSLVEKQRHRVELEKQFFEFLGHVGMKQAEKMSQTQLYANFWRKQIEEKNATRRKMLQTDKDFQDAVKLSEAKDEDDMERYVEKVLSHQQNKGRLTYPVQKSKNTLGLGYGAPLVASDDFDNKIFTQTKDIFYTPEVSRNRMSINWYPKN